MKKEVTCRGRTDAARARDPSAAASPITRTYTVTAASSIKLASSLNPAQKCRSVAFSVTVTGSGLITPTGKVELKKGSTVLATATLNNGRARLSTSALPVGTNMLTASYEGDASNPAATSPEFREVVLSSGSCNIIQPVLPPVDRSPRLF